MVAATNRIRRLVSALMLAGAGLVSVARGGDVCFELLGAFPCNNSPYDMAVGDLNGDGLPDVVVTNQNQPTLLGPSILMNDGTGGLLAPFSVGTSVPTSVAIADVNGDGRLDIICGAVRPNAYVLINQGPAVFTVVALPPIPFNAGYVAAFDVDGDGDVDIIFGGATGFGEDRAVFIRNDGTLSFAVVGHQQLNVSQPTSVLRDLTAADLDGDGRKELVAFSRALNTFIVYYYDPFINDFDRVPLKGFGDIAQGAFGELNGAPGIDAVVLRNDNSGLKVLANDGAGAFSVLSRRDGGRRFPRCVAIGDWDGDGKNDFAFGDYENVTVEVWRNEGDDRFRSRQSVNTGSSGRRLAAADMNADGRIDLVGINNATHSDPGFVAVLLNCGDQ